MKRLTQPGHEYQSLEFMEDGVYIYMNLLREYEDTGLTPGEIMELKKRDMAIKALEEIQQYREIGTVEECQKAWKSGYDVGYVKGYDDGYALGITQPI